MRKKSATTSIALTSLAKKIAQLTEEGDKEVTAIPGLSLYRRDAPTKPVSVMYEPSICISAQGAKRVLLGEEKYVYNAQNFLITSVHLPVVAEVIEASPKKPFLAIRLTLDRREISQLMVDSNLPPSREQEPSRGMAEGKISLPLISAFQRLLDLLAEPKDIRILGPIIQREILYRLLIGERGSRLRQIALAGNQSQIAQSVDWIKNHFAEAVRVENLAAQVHMTTSTFHHHFRTLTAMSPLQFQKWLRLNEARRLMLTERLDAATASIRVGYESPSQFNREYRRLYGAPPLRDVIGLRKAAPAGKV